MYNNYESNYEFSPQQKGELEMENSNYEFNNEFEFNPEFELEQDYESTNEFEDEFVRRNNYTVHDHRTGNKPVPGRVYSRSGNFRPPNVTRRPVGSYSQPYYRPSAYRRSPGYRNHYSTGHSNYPWYYRFPQGPNSYFNVGNDYNRPMSNVEMSNAPGVNQTAPAENSGGNIPNYILDTIKNLSRQMSATNANVEALQQSLSNPAAQGSNGQQKAGSPMTEPINSNGGALTQQISNDQMESLEMENYELENYEMENYENEMNDEMMDYSHENELSEMEFAAELLGTNNEMELDNFLGGLLGGGGLTKLLKRVVKAALPVARRCRGRDVWRAFGRDGWSKNRQGRV
jgi:hypothetical protein